MSSADRDLGMPRPPRDRGGDGSLRLPTRRRRWHDKVQVTELAAFELPDGWRVCYSMLEIEGKAPALGLRREAPDGRRSRWLLAEQRDLEALANAVARVLEARRGETP